MNNLVGTKKYTGINSGKAIRFSFAGTIASGWDDAWQLVSTGSGMTIAQASGNGTIASGTTTNSETILRFRLPISGDSNIRSRIALSQRIVNQSFYLECVDVIGDGLAVTVNSATSVTIAFPQTFIPSSANVGQSMNIGAISGIAGAVPGRYAIASVSGQNVTFTVAGWPASGTGTASVFGYNGTRLTYDGATATSGKFDSYRNGYGTGDTTATIATTASPGQVSSIHTEDGLISVGDSTQNSLAFTPRFSRSENIPDQSTVLYVQVRVLNGTVAPASTTTFTVNYVNVDEWESNVVSFGRQPGSAAAPAVTISGTPPVTITSGTVTTVSAVTGGGAAEDAAAGANPLTIGGVVRTAVAPTTLVAGDAARVTMTAGAAAVVKPYAVPETDWQMPAPVGGILNTATAFQLMPAPGALLRNYVTSLDLYSEALTNATDLRIREPDLTCNSQTIATNILTVSATHNLTIGDAVVFTASTVTGITAGVTYYVLTVPAATTITLSASRGGSTLAISGTGVTATFHKILWMTRIPTTGAAPRTITFPTPLRGSINTILQIQTPTASGAGAVYSSLQGFISQ